MGYHGGPRTTRLWCFQVIACERSERNTADYVSWKVPLPLANVRSNAALPARTVRDTTDVPLH